MTFSFYIFPGHINMGQEDSQGPHKVSSMIPVKSPDTKEKR